MRQLDEVLLCPTVPFPLTIFGYQIWLTTLLLRFFFVIVRIAYFRK